jgi:hypothetical protein
LGVKLAFSLQKVEQIEDKTLTVRYNRQSAVRRTYAPQGLLRLLAEDLDGPPHFLEVDLDSPFFRTLDLEIEAPSVFEQIGLMKSDVSIEYGRPADPVNLKHKDVSFRPTGSKLETASFFLNQELDLEYRYRVQYHFDALSGWDGEKLSYDLPPATTLDRTLLVNPFRDFGFLEVKVIPADLDPSAIDSTDVLLHYEDPGAWTRDKTITVKPDSPEQLWKLRLSDPEQREFSYRFVHRLKNGSTRETEPVTTLATLVTVNDPFEEPLIVEFFPNYDATNVNTLFVDVIFEDPGLGIRREEQLRFIGQTLESQRLRFARSSPAARELSFQITILGNDNSVRRLPPVMTENTIVFLGEHIRSESAARRRAMGFVTSQETRAPTGNGRARINGKTYGYQQPRAESGMASDASLAAAKAQLVDAFERFVDLLVSAYQPAAGGSPPSASPNGDRPEPGASAPYAGSSTGSTIGPSGSATEVTSGRYAGSGGQGRRVEAGHAGAIGKAPGANGAGKAGTRP